MKTQTLINFEESYIEMTVEEIIDAMLVLDRSKALDVALALPNIDMLNRMNGKPQQARFEFQGECYEMDE